MGFHEDEAQNPVFQVILLVPYIYDDRVQEEKKQINHVELDQQETLSMPSPTFI